MDTLVSSTCPRVSPKDLMDKLQKQMSVVLGKKTPSTLINDIYSSAKTHSGSQTFDYFVASIEQDLGPKRSPSFKLALKDPTVRKILNDVQDRVDVQNKRASGSATINANDGSTTISLVCRLQQTTGDSVEDAIRNIFFDIRKARKFHGRADLVAGDKIIEIKYSRGDFSSLATDSQALVPNPSKWYLYVSGEVPVGTTGPLKAWFINSEDLYNSLLPSTQDDLIEPIRPQGENALRDIENEIEQIKSSLAQAILNKSTPAGSSTERAPVQMSLQRKVGVNRVRFDIKFEGLLRAYVKEILRS